MPFSTSTPQQLYNAVSAVQRCFSALHGAQRRCRILCYDVFNHFVLSHNWGSRCRINQRERFLQSTSKNTTVLYGVIMR